MKECWMVLRALLSGESLREGFNIKLYEKKAAETMGCKYARSFATGRQALYAILKSLGIGEGDEVLIQAFTCVVVPRAINYVGAVPIYVDIDRCTLNMDSGQIRQHISDKTKGIIVQHTFGKPADIGTIQEIADYYGLYLIEDCCHAVGCKYIGKPVGSFGHVGFYSSDHTKMISTSTGGMAFTNIKKVAGGLEKNRGRYLSRFRVLQIAFTFIMETIITHPRGYWFLRSLRGILNKTRVFYFHRDENSLGKPKNYPARLSNIQSLIGLSQLEKLKENLDHRRKFSVENLPLLRISLWSERAKERFGKRWRKYMVPGVWYNSPVFGCKNLDTVNYKMGSCPVAEKVAKRIINFPTHLRRKLR